MPALFPSHAVLRDAFGGTNSYASFHKKTQPASARSKWLARPELYSAFSVADDAKAKASQLSNAAVKEFEKASSAVQAKTGKIELYSYQFYASCTFGGLLACVSPARTQLIFLSTNMLKGSDTYRRHSTGFGQVSSSSRS